MRVLLVLALVAALPSAVDSLFAVALALAARRGRRTGEPVRRLSWLVLVPARNEGESVAPTLRSILAAASAAGARQDVAALLVLDGPDDAARRAAEGLGVRVVEKGPAGPSKGALLRWTAGALSTEIDRAEAILLLDVGSRLPENFFAHFTLPGDAAAAQAWIAGSGAGVGEAAALSDRYSQGVEDAGRQALGWSVRLRGFGMALSPAAFREIVPGLRTRVEDHEASVLLAAAGHRCVLGPVEGPVLDDKPTRTADAAAQRARWLVGRWHLLAAHPAAFARIVARSPLEGIAFVAEIGARPLTATIPLRLAAGTAAAILAVLDRSPILAACSVGCLGSALLTLATLASARALDPRAAAGLAAAWARAVPLLPAAISRWTRVRR